jgi:hypothetical protein
MFSNTWPDRSSFYEHIASESLWQMLSDQFGVNRWTGRAVCRGEKSSVAIGTTASGENVDFVIEIVEMASNFTLDGVSDGMAAFPKIFTTQTQKPLYGLIAAVNFPRSIAKKAREAGFYRAILDAQTSEFKRLLPPPTIKNYNRVRTYGES